MSILDEARSKLTMEHLNHAPDHLSDLIKEKRLAFKVEADEFNGTRVTFLSNS